MAETWIDVDGDEKLRIDSYVEDSMYSTIIDLKNMLRDLLSSPYGEETIYPVEILYRDQVSETLKVHGKNCIGIQLVTIEPVSDLDGKDSVTFVASIEIHGVFGSARGRDNAYDKGLLLMEQLLYFFVDTDSYIYKYLHKKGITFLGTPSLDLRPDFENENTEVDIVLNIDLKYNVEAEANGAAIVAIVKKLYDGDVLYEEHVVGELPEED